MLVETSSFTLLLLLDVLRLAAAFQCFGIWKGYEGEASKRKENSMMIGSVDEVCYIDPVVCQKSIIVNTFPSTKHKHNQIILGRLVYTYMMVQPLQN